MEYWRGMVSDGPQIYIPLHYTPNLFSSLSPLLFVLPPLIFFFLFSSLFFFSFFLLSFGTWLCEAHENIRRPVFGPFRFGDLGIGRHFDNARVLFLNGFDGSPGRVKIDVQFLSLDQTRADLISPCHQDTFDLEMRKELSNLDYFAFRVSGTLPGYPPRC